MKKWFLAILGLGVATVVGAQGNTWTRVDTGGETICADGSGYAFWTHTGTMNRLLLFFEGGGGCWDYETCQPGSSFYDANITSSDNPATRQGILDLDNPDNPFYGYSAVFIPYCTGDVHMGSNTQTYQAEDGRELTVHHNGFVNTSAALQWVYENYAEPESVFLTGCSAGSVGSIFHAPYIIEQYPDAELYQMGDSLSFTFHRPLNLQADYHAHDNFPSWIPALGEIVPGEFTMAQYYAAVANYYPDHTFSQYNTLYDHVQQRYYTAIGGDAENWVTDFEAALGAIHESAANFRSYTASGDRHCITPFDLFYTVETEGVRLRDWIADMANGDEIGTVHCTNCD